MPVIAVLRPGRQRRGKYVSVRWRSWALLVLAAIWVAQASTTFSIQIAAATRGGFFDDICFGASASQHGIDGETSGQDSVAWHCPFLVLIDRPVLPAVYGLSIAERCAAASPVVCARALPIRGDPAFLLPLVRAPPAHSMSSRQS